MLPCASSRRWPLIQSPKSNAGVLCKQFPCLSLTRAGHGAVTGVAVALAAPPAAVVLAVAPAAWVQAGLGAAAACTL